MTTVDLRPAFAWDCESCGRENFARAVRYELSEEELAELRADHGVESWHEGEFLLAPKQVTCAHCGGAFTARDDRDNDE